jgi:hypothetical protein
MTQIKCRGTFREFSAISLLFNSRGSKMRVSVECDIRLKCAIGPTWKPQEFGRISLNPRLFLSPPPAYRWPVICDILRAILCPLLGRSDFEMSVMTGLEDYAKEVEEQVCRRCVSHASPCAPQGVNCGVESHLEKLVEICHSVDGTLIDPYLDRLHDEICATCTNRPTKDCPCPLEYLLPLAVVAIETVDRRRKFICDRLALKFKGVQDTD